MDFYDLDLNDSVLDALDAMRFETCTPVQEKCIPPLLEGRDLIGVAQTGTGKTAAYLLPILSRLADGGFPADAVNCLIMAPTRELAQQIDQAMEGFSYFLNVSSVAVYGGNDGVRFEQERRGLKLGADVIIATPGRLISHLAMGGIDLSRTSFFVLDEADRMLDMGFSDDILQIEKALPKERQTILFSATMPEKIVELAKTIMHDPVEVKIAVSKPAEKIQQSAYVCRDAQKVPILKQMFRETTPERVIIFASSKQKVKELNVVLKRHGFNAEAMHSDLEQKERDDVMLRFKNRQIGILVATDIVSRGIDIDDIQLVVNFDVPHDAEDYVHRIGRTARAGRGGRAVTFVNEKDMPKFRAIERFLEKEIPRNPLPDGMTPPSAGEGSTGQGRDNRKGGRGGGRHDRSRGGHGHGRKRPASGATPSATTGQTEAVTGNPDAATEKPDAVTGMTGTPTATNEAKSRSSRGRHRRRRPRGGNNDKPQA